MREQKLQCPGQGPLALMPNASCGRCRRWGEGLGKSHMLGARALGRAWGGGQALNKDWGTGVGRI